MKPKLLLLLAAITSPLQAGTGIWTPLGPESATVTALAVDPRQSSVVYAGTESGGLFKSLDGGLSWRSASVGLLLADLPAPPRITTIVPDPFRTQTVYVVSQQQSGLFRTVDGGTAWSSIGRLGSQGELRFLSLVADPRQPRVLYGGTPTGVYRSQNGGSTWKPYRDALPQVPVSALVFDPQGRDLYAGLQGGALYRSANAIQKWKRVDQGPTPPLYRLAIDPRRPSTFYAESDRRPFRSLDGGKSWSPAALGLVEGGPVGIGFQDGVVYAATSRGVFRSPDGGTTWSQAAAASDPIALSFAAGPESLYLGTAGQTARGGVFRSDDGGASWQLRPHGLNTLEVFDLAPHPADPQRLYLAAGGVGLFRTSNGGASWSLQTFGPPGNSNLRSIVVEPSQPDTLFASQTIQNPLVRSDDGGATWSGVEAASTPPSLTLLAPDLLTPTGLWAAGYGSAGHSTDGGVSWSQVDRTTSPLPNWLDLEVDSDDPARIYLAGNIVVGVHGERNSLLLWSDDGGASWKSFPLASLSSSYALEIALDRSLPGVVYALTDSGLFRSEGPASLWNRIQSSGPFGGTVLTTQDALYLSRAGLGVLRSRDHGATWTPIRAGLGGKLVRHLFADPTNPRHLFAATSNAGLWEYTFPPGP